VLVHGTMGKIRGLVAGSGRAIARSFAQIT
jgi:hypothetical protein